jgi:predicted CxxxxCH...CXXCH cytochrome family protein
MWLLPLLACTQEPPPAGHTGGPVPTEPPPTVPGTFDPGFLDGQFCQVRAIFEIACTTGCHSAAVPEAGLDLLTDPYAATVLVPSVDGGYLVVPGDPAASVLLQRMKGPSALGGPMPPQGTIDPIFPLAVEGWIAAGAPNDCEVGAPPPPPTTTPTTEGRHHPEGWSDPAQHGPGAMLQTGGDCRSCHGEALDGGSSGVSCDGCHAPGWRTDCTYCHGGTLNTTGAPPQDIDDNADPATISFPEHPEHVTAGIHPAYGCVQCHTRPTDVLTPGHWFDDLTAGYGELNYTGGLAPIATYFQGTCSNVYCHGNGRVPGEVASGQAVGCGDCHPGPADTGLWGAMSGEHQTHLQSGVTCDECHQGVVDAAGAVIGTDLHVQGAKDVLAPGAPYVNGTCTGTCHGEDHAAQGW